MKLAGLLAAVGFMAPAANAAVTATQVTTAADIGIGQDVNVTVDWTRTSAGGVSVNTVVWHVGNPHLPFGGVGESGMGAYHGRHGFETFSHRKSVLKKSTKVDPKMAYPPYTKFKKALIKRFA